MKYILIGVTIIITTTIAITLLNQNIPPEENSSNNIAETCIITILGEQYDVTTLRGSHPGGDIYECDTDMTNTFQSQHGNDLQRIEKYKVEEEK